MKRDLVEIQPVAGGCYNVICDGVLVDLYRNEAAARRAACIVRNVYEQGHKAGRASVGAYLRDLMGISEDGQ